MPQGVLPKIKTIVMPESPVIAFLLGGNKEMANGEIVIETGIIGAFMEGRTQDLISALSEPARALGIELDFEYARTPPNDCLLAVYANHVPQYLACRLLADPQYWKHDQQTGTAQFTLPTSEIKSVEGCKAAFGILGFNRVTETAEHQLRITSRDFARLQGVIPSLKPWNSNVVEAVKLLVFAQSAMYFK